MTEQDVIDKVCDRMVITLYNELDYYMFEELGHTETNDKNYICDYMSDYIEELGIELNEIIYKVKSI